MVEVVIFLPALAHFMRSNFLIARQHSSQCMLVKPDFGGDCSCTAYFQQFWRLFGCKFAVTCTRTGQFQKSMPATWPNTALQAAFAHSAWIEFTLRACRVIVCKAIAA
jgi:hypothetical protein